MKILNSDSQYVFSIILVEKLRFVRLNWNSLFEITYESKLTYLLLGHLLSGSILNHLMHSKDAECILMFLSAMPRGVSVAHIYVLKLPLHLL